MSAPKQPSPNEHDDEQGNSSSQIQDLISRLTLETRLHAELRKNHDDMIASSEDYIESLQQEIVTLEQTQWHEREKLQDVINGLAIKCQILERKRDMCESVEEISLMKIKDMNALEDEREIREDAFYSRQSKAYRKATQKYQESVAETSQSIAHEAVIAYIDTHALSASKDALSGDKGKSLRPNVSLNKVKKLGKNGTAEFLDKQLDGLRVSRKNLALEVEILEEANQQQAKIILQLRKRLARFSESSLDQQDIDLSQVAKHDAMDLSASSLLGVVPSLSDCLDANALCSSDDDFGSSTMLTECRSNSRKSFSRDTKHRSATPKFVSQMSRASTTSSGSSNITNSSAARSIQSSGPSLRKQNIGFSSRRGIAAPKESSTHIAWNQPHPEYEEVLRVCQTAKISDEAQAIMQNKQDKSGTRLLIRLLSGLHPDPQLCPQ